MTRLFATLLVRVATALPTLLEMRIRGSIPMGKERIAMKAKLAGVMAVVGVAGMAWGQDLPLTQEQTMNQISPLDPTRSVSAPMLESKRHTPLQEEYVWTANDASADAKLIYTFPKVTEQTEPHYFRASFQVGAVPKEATLYLAGPRRVKVWLNGMKAEEVESDVTSPLGIDVFATEVPKLVRTGRNVIAIEAVRGRGVTGFANSALVRQQTFGQVLVGKIVPAAHGVDAPALMRTGRDWKSSVSVIDGWEQAGFDIMEE